LDVQKLLRLVGMSRTDFHRKLYRAAGMSATEYLRKRRLEKAAELLRQEPKWSIYQVALEVGFENQSYFTVRVTEVLGCCPYAWRGRLEHA
jgi:AraC-like DNA-binding protein